MPGHPEYSGCAGFLLYMTKHKTSFTLSPIAKRLLSILAFRRGLSRTAVLETLIRAAAQAEGISSDELGKVEWKPEEQK